jgi:hypothetical protein
MAGNSTYKKVNARSFNPDKGLPLIATRPGQAVGKGAAAQVCKDYQCPLCPPAKKDKD